MATIGYTKGASTTPTPSIIALAARKAPVQANRLNANGIQTSTNRRKKAPVSRTAIVAPKAMPMPSHVANDVRMVLKARIRSQTTSNVRNTSMAWWPIAAAANNNG